MSTESPFLPPADTELDRFLAGELTGHERDVIAQVVARDPVMAALAHRLSQPVSQPGRRDVGAATRQDQAWARVQAESAAAQHRGERSSSRVRTSAAGIWLRRTLIAGAVMGAFAAIYAGSRSLGHRTPRDTMHRFATVAGQRAQVTLPDGSRATLAPATTLDVTREDGTMSVSIRGEAMFSVVHDAARPFVVRTPQSVTHVLGTTFVVRNYTTDRSSLVFVLDGRVSLLAMQDGRPHGTAHVLSARMRGVVTDSGSVTVTPNVDPSAHSGWTTGALVFSAARVSDVVADLSRAYGTNIQLTDSALAQRRINWYVHTANSSLAQVLAELSTILDARVTRAGERILLTPGRRATQRSTPVRSPLPLESQYGR